MEKNPALNVPEGVVNNNLLSVFNCKKDAINGINGLSELTQERRIFDYFGTIIGGWRNRLFIFGLGMFEKNFWARTGMMLASTLDTVRVISDPLGIF